jgi:nitroreductase
MHRAYTDAPLAEADLSKLTWAAARAPLGGGQLTRRIILVTDPGRLLSIRQVTPSLLAKTPVILVICTDLKVAEEAMGRLGRNVLSLLDSGAAAANVGLAAVALGLGVCNFRSSNDVALREVLLLPEHVRVDILIAVGHPAYGIERAHKAEAPVIYRNVYGDAEEG